MNSLLLSSVCVLLTIALAIQVRGAKLPEDDLLAGYDPADVEAVLERLEDPRLKRGMCRQGYTYQAILRSCVPSLGALRGRGGRGRY